MQRTGKASQSIYVVKNVLYLNLNRAVQKFSVSLLMYFQPVFYTSTYAREKKTLGKVFHVAKNLELDVGPRYHR